jgi:hypothetical protein
MMLNLSETQKTCIQEEDENITRKKFEEMGFTVKPLDKRRGNNQSRRTDFLVERGKDIIIVEVKTILSAGTATVEGEKKSYGHASVFDRGLDNLVFSYESDPKLRDLLSSAQDQYDETCKESGFTKRPPLIVAIFDQSGFMWFKSLKQDFFGCDEVSAVIWKGHSNWKYIKNRNCPCPIYQDVFLNFEEVTQE